VGYDGCKACGSLIICEVTHARWCSCLGGKYSEALLETLGRDACDAGHSCKCVAFALLTEIMAPVAGANESRTDAHALRKYVASLAMATRFV
jgi:hypothetical protein